MKSSALKQKFYLHLTVQVLLVLFLFRTFLPEAGECARPQALNVVKQSQQDLFIPLQNEAQNLKLEAKQTLLFIKRFDFEPTVQLPEFLCKSFDLHLFKRNSFYTCISINAP